MAGIGQWADVIGERQRSVWPKAAEAAVACNGLLVGGTALTLHLRHRVSEDLDILAPGPFDAEGIRDLLRRQAEAELSIIGFSPHEVHVLLDGVSVHIFEDPNAEHRTGDVVVLEEGPTVDAMPVASLADLLALKLDLVRWRSSLRDLMDLVAIDQTSGLRLEDGLGLWVKKFSAAWDNAALDRIILQLRFPSAKDADPLFDHSRDEVIAYLKGRVPQVEDALRRGRMAAG